MAIKVRKQKACNWSVISNTSKKGARGGIAAAVELTAALTVGNVVVVGAGAVRVWAALAAAVAHRTSGTCRT